MIVQAMPYPASGGGASFGWLQAVEGNTSQAETIFASEHNAASYVNNTGAAITVAYVDLLFCVVGVGQTVDVQLALYSDSGSNTPGTLLSVTEKKTMVSGGGFEYTSRFTLVTPSAVANNARIWVAARKEGSFGFRQTNGSRTSDGRYKFKSASAGTAFAASWGGTATNFGRIIPARLIAA